jgi:hypothetical protein
VAAVAVELNFRNIKPSEVKMIQEWWVLVPPGIPPTDDMLPLESTFMMDVANVPAVCITIYTTNSKEFAMLDNLIANPKLVKKSSRSWVVERTVRAAEKHARSLGFKKLICFASEPKLAKRYSQLGYNVTAQKVTSLVKEL